MLLWRNQFITLEKGTYLHTLQKMFRFLYLKRNQRNQVRNNSRAIIQSSTESKPRLFNLVLHYLPLWLAQKTRAPFSTKQIKRWKQSRSGSTLFPALKQLTCFNSEFRLAAHEIFLLSYWSFKYCGFGATTQTWKMLYCFKYLLYQEKKKLGDWDRKVVQFVLFSITFVLWDLRRI